MNEKHEGNSKQVGPKVKIEYHYLMGENCLCSLSLEDSLAVLGGVMSRQASTMFFNCENVSSTSSKICNIILSSVHSKPSRVCLSQIFQRSIFYLPQTIVASKYPGCNWLISVYKAILRTLSDISDSLYRLVVDNFSLYVYKERRRMSSTTDRKLSAWRLYR